MIVKYLILGIILSCIMFIYSCSGNPIDPNTNAGFDSARYNWKTYEINNSGFSTINKIFAIDTNILYLVNNADGNILQMRNDGVQNIIKIPGFIPVSITGINNNNIYFLGNTMLNGNKYIVTYKWDGNTYDELSIPNLKNFTDEIVQNSLIDNTNLWIITSTKSFKINLLNNDFIYFERDDPNTTVVYFYTYNGMPHYLSEEFIVFTDVKYRLYEFSSENWNKKIFYDYNSTNPAPIILQGIVYGGLQHEIFIYEGAHLFLFLNLTILTSTILLMPSP